MDRKKKDPIQNMRRMQQETEELKKNQNFGNRQPNPRPNQVQAIIDSIRQSPISDKPMTMDEKTTLKNSIGAITPDQQKGIIQIV